MPTPLLADSLARLPGIAHGFFTRHGGVSQGIYASLNCGLGSKDDPAAVHENRARVAAHLGANDLLTAYQVHSATALFVDKAWPAQERPRADAIVTATPGLAVGVLTADCAPVLFADRAGRRRGGSPRRLARRARRRARSDHRGHGRGWAPGGNASTRPSAPASARLPTRWAQSSKPSFWGTTPPMQPFSPLPMRQDGRISIFPSMLRTACGGRVCRRSMP